jgi:D-alanine-D-alanine ligase
MGNAMSRPTRVLLLCGGRSEEHEVSLASARSVLQATRGELDITPLVIDRLGRLLPPGASRAALAAAAEDTGASVDGAAPRSEGAPHRVATDTVPTAGNAPAALVGALDRLGRDGYDVVFPLLHGPNGEDGSVQGLLKVMGMPHVGSAVLGSAVGMDKLVMKAVFAAHGLPQVAHAGVQRGAWRRDRAAALRALVRLPWPRFVKPANLGSSIGIARADDEPTLIDAIESALAFDRRVIIEQGVPGARELEVAVLGNDEPEASDVGEIRHHSGFYDYDTKYTDGSAELLIPAPLPPAVAERARTMALDAFRAVDAAGLSRVDFFYREPEGELLLNEINTMPGFTRTSMYPRLWEARGVAYAELVRRLVELALERR